MNKKIISFEDFEKAVMEKLLEEDTSVNKILQEQYKKAQVEDRIFTGVGFFTHFKISEDSPCVIEPVEYGYGNVSGKINGIDIGFVLFIKNGIMTCLEGYTYYTSWPDLITHYELWHDEKQIVSKTETGTTIIFKPLLNTITRKP